MEEDNEEGEVSNDGHRSIFGFVSWGGELWFTEARENLKHRLQRGGGGDGGGWED